MTQKILTNDQLSDYHRQGYLVVRGLYDPDEMRDVTEWTSELQGWPEIAGKHMMYFEESMSRPPRRVLNRIENFVPFHSGLGRLVSGGKIRHAVSALFGEDSVLFKEKINFKLPGGGGFEAHQDAQAGWNTYADLFITAMVTIDPATIENGCLELGNWRHRPELIGDLWRPLDDGQLEEVSFEAVPTAPGDVMFFDSYLPHRSSPNFTKSPRRVLYITYNKASAGDHRTQYFADKHQSYPPDCEREAGKAYAYRV